MSTLMVLPQYDTKSKIQESKLTFNKHTAEDREVELAMRSKSVSKLSGEIQDATSMTRLGAKTSGH